MKFELNSRPMGRLIGVGMAVAVTVSWTVASQILRVRENGAAVTANSNNVPQSAGNDESNPVMIPFNDVMNDDLHEVYSEIVKSEQKKRESGIELNRSELPSQTTVSDAAEATEATTQATTQTTEASTEATAETSVTEASSEQTVSNGQLPFNYNDVCSIAADMNQLDDFVNKLHPTSLAWDTSDYTEHGFVHITLTSSYGVVMLDVKPIVQESDMIEPYTIDGAIVGSVNTSALPELDWYQRNKDSGCGIRSVTWLKAGFAVTPVRGIDVGAELAELTDHYLCVNGGGTTLYKAADVIMNEDKLNALVASENAYTFVGGRLYTISGYLDKYYSGKADSYQFADCDMIVQYGCNSIVDHNYISGSWIIEYAIKDDVVSGITFMNKSYYKKREVHGGATSSSTSSTNIVPDREDTTATTVASVTEEAAVTSVAESGESTAVTEPTEGLTTETLPEPLG